MSKLNDLIKKYCPNGVERKKLWELTSWNKKFNGIEKEKQKKIVPIKCILASEFEKIKQNSGNVKYIATGISGGDQYTNEKLAGDYLFEGEVVCIPGGGIPNVKYHNGKFITSDNRIATSLNKNILNNKFLYYYLDSKTKDIKKFYRGSGIKHPDMSKVLELKIPIPPLPVQEEIVKILDKFTDLENDLENELRMRKMQFNAYRDKLLTFDNGVRFEKINTCYKLYSGMSEVSQKWKESGNCKFIDYKNIYNHLKIDVHDKPYANVKKLSQNIVKQYDILITAASEIPEECAITAVVEESIEDGIFLDDHAFGMHLIDNRVNSTFVNYYMQTQSFKNDVRKKVKGVTRFFISPSDIGALTIPVPPLEKQREIVEKLDKFNDMCNEISDGLPLEIELRKKQYEFYSDKLLSFDKNGWVRVV